MAFSTGHAVDVDVDVDVDLAVDVDVDVDLDLDLDVDLDLDLNVRPWPKLFSPRSFYTRACRPTEVVMNYRRLDVYQLAIRFLPIAVQVTESLPKGYSALADQLRRASLSIPLNVAEGSGKISAPDQRRFYAIARGSAMECGAIIDSCQALERVGVETATTATKQLTSIVRMLSKMCRS